MKASSSLIFMLIFVLPFAAFAQFTTGQNASGVIGQNGFTYMGANITDSIGMDWPSGIAVDPVSGALYVADPGNNRVLRFANLASLTNGCAAIGELGQPDFASAYGGTAQNRMNYPCGVAVDGSGNLYVADCMNNRVLKFANAAGKPNGGNADVVLGQADFTTKDGAAARNRMQYVTDVAVDGSGNLYVADGLHNRVLKFVNAASKVNGANADMVLGQPDFTSCEGATSQNGMSCPEGVAIDGSGNLYVADCDNSRVLIYTSVASKANGDQADVVLGQPDFTTSGENTTVNGMSYPYSVAVDASGNLYVADDDGNNRVLKFANAASKDNGADADAVFGQTGFTSNEWVATQCGMNSPNGVAVDGSGNLYVGDSGNNRVLIFTAAASKSSGANANIVLGQTCFTKGGNNIVDVHGLHCPDLIAVDPVSGALYVADEQNNRVLRFANASSYSAGEGALGVLGQPDFTSNNSATSRSGMYIPTGVAVDGTGNLYVADYFNKRVLIFLSAASKPNGSDADVVLGQSDFTSSTDAVTRSGMSYTYGVAVDGSGTLYAADQSNNRVLIFMNAASLTNGADADVVLGQPNFTSNGSSSPPRQNGLNNPRGVAVDNSGNLYVADPSENRVLKFANAASKSNGADADMVLGQSGFTSSTQASTRSGMNYPEGVAVDGSGTLYVTDNNDCRVLIFKNAGSLANGADADVVLGQNDFTSSGFGITQSNMYFPCGVAVDNHARKLYVSDNALNRVLVFDASSELPVELASFIATTANSGALLEWKTATEINNAGFDVERKSMNNEQSTMNSWTKVGFVAGHGTTNAPQQYSYSDNVGTAGTYSYRLKQIDHNGAFTYSQEVSVQAGEVPRVFAFAQNYPNPFNPTTTLQFTVPNDGRATLKVYNAIGQEVATLFDGVASAGEYHQATFDGSGFASGVYLARLVFSGQTLVKKLLMTK